MAAAKSSWALLLASRSRTQQKFNSRRRPSWRPLYCGRVGARRRIGCNTPLLALMYFRCTTQYCTDMYMITVDHLIKDGHVHIISVLYCTSYITPKSVREWMINIVSYRAGIYTGGDSQMMILVDRWLSS